MAIASWEFLIAEAGLAAVLPEEYVHFARPIRDGLTIFLGGLPEADQQAILQAQADLPADAAITERLGVLARCSPVLQKLAQVLARDQRLPLELRLELRQLESLPPTIPLATIQSLLTQELGPLDHRGLTLMPPAIAEASVAVVIPYRQAEFPGSEATDGVFKILKPGIEERLEFELSLLQRVGEHLDQRCDELKIPHLHYQEAFEQVQEKLVDEVQLENEQRHLRWAKQLFANEPAVEIPTVFAHCSRRVTAMSRVSGVKVTDHALQGGIQQRRLAHLVARALIAQPIFSRGEQALFHADPHAGNLLLTDEGKLAILDWSLVGRLGERERQTIVQVLLGAVTLDSRHIISELRSLSQQQPHDAESLDAVVRRWLRRVRRGHFPGFSWLTGMLDDAVQQARLRVTTDLMLFRKTLHTVSGLLVDVGEVNVLDEVLLAEFFKHFMAEWPHRWLRQPYSRAFSTRLSNLDLSQLLLSCPTTAARFWTGHALDLVKACTATRGEADADADADADLAPPVDTDLSLQPESPCPSNV